MRSGYENSNLKINLLVFADDLAVLLGSIGTATEHIKNLKEATEKASL